MKGLGALQSVLYTHISSAMPPRGICVYAGNAQADGCRAGCLVFQEILLGAYFVWFYSNGDPPCWPIISERPFLKENQPHLRVDWSPGGDEVFFVGGERKDSDISVIALLLCLILQQSHSASVGTYNRE